MTCDNCDNLLGSIRQLTAKIERLGEKHEAKVIRQEQIILDLRRANRANRSRWKNARRDFLAVRNQRDAYEAVILRTAEAINPTEVVGVPNWGVVADGFGSHWLRCGENCDLQVVRPGRCQCNYADNRCPNRPGVELAVEEEQ